eukprot:TRINITY_DN2572_c4_g1_i1.p1 TRINITY_DN2572_c4_g1~~TRINITY_DN2572_c4_g1_i1.p1  ORF type:complete len:391 (+),score=71.54 TRINITY_DN2572_c4_g1_i1:52-1173(+)
MTPTNHHTLASARQQPDQKQHQDKEQKQKQQLQDEATASPPVGAGSQCVGSADPQFSEPHCDETLKAEDHAPAAEAAAAEEEEEAGCYCYEGANAFPCHPYPGPYPYPTTMYDGCACGASYYDEGGYSGGYSAEYYPYSYGAAAAAGGGGGYYPGYYPPAANGSTAPAWAGPPQCPLPQYYQPGPCHPDCVQSAECCCYSCYSFTAHPLAPPAWLATESPASTAPPAPIPAPVPFPATEGGDDEEEIPQPSASMYQPPEDDYAEDSGQQEGRTVHQQEQSPNGVGVELTVEQLHSVDPVRYKTRLCTAYQQGKPCEYGERCLFAHGQDELRFPASNFAALLRANKLPRHIRKYYTAKFLGEEFLDEVPAASAS